MSRPAALLLLALLGCAAGTSSIDDEAAAFTGQPARDLAYTHTYEVRFGAEELVTGYVIEFYSTPEGMLDRRLYPVGTVLVQDTDLVTIAFITPGGRAYTFDDRGDAHDRGFDGRDDHVQAILAGSGRPHYTSTTPHLPTDA